MPKLRFAIIQVFPLFLFLYAAQAQWRPRNPITSVTKQVDAVTFTQETGSLRLQVCTDSIIHLLYAPNSDFHEHPNFVITKTSWETPRWSMQETADEVTVATTRLKVTVEKIDAAITYDELGGQQLVQDANRWLTPETVDGEQAYHAEDFFSLYGSHEGLYGLGQHQAGVWNYRGESIDISQDNSNISIPLLVSSKGYAIFWNNESRSRFNNRFANYLYLSSEVADAVDYYFFYGPDLDKIIADYRDLTGQAPLFGKWAYGFWQCKNRYRSQEEILAIARKYRALHIPADNIVQDWFWWNRKGEFVFNKNYPDPKGMVDQLHGDHFHLMISIWPFFEPGSANYEYMDKQGWFVDKFKFAKPPYHTDGMAVYDATNPDARKFYWDQVNKSLFSIGFDAWWMDTTEPETEGQEENILLGHKLAAGSGDRYVNDFPLLDTGAVYNGQRQASDRKRAFILSRSAFAGSQRNAVTAWSGDIVSDWLTFRRQVPAGLNFELSGIPYWTTDIGGFVFASPSDPAFRELFVRWFEWAAFNPIFRVHGTRANPDANELWSYGPEAQKILVAYDRLRYRLLPYTYSLAWRTTSESYTPMRPLVMDFRTDPVAADVGDQFMYGPAFLVNPVTAAGATSRTMYLPVGRWLDFWSGQALSGAKWISASAPLNRIPLYVRAGAIVPLGPEIEWSTEKPADPLEIRVYGGGDGSFTLYEDQNDTYDYEKGVYATIPFHWDDLAHTLTIGDRKGEFPGMLQSRTFHIVFVRDKRGTGIEPGRNPDRVVTYVGKQITAQP
jgi:alpha-D-xyloside xylohydrolase